MKATTHNIIEEMKSKLINKNENNQIIFPEIIET